MTVSCFDERQPDVGVHSHGASRGEMEKCRLAFEGAPAGVPKARRAGGADGLHAQREHPLVRLGARGRGAEGGRGVDWIARAARLRHGALQV